MRPCTEGYPSQFSRGLPSEIVSGLRKGPLLGKGCNQPKGKAKNPPPKKARNPTRRKANSFSITRRRSLPRKEVLEGGKAERLCGGVRLSCRGLCSACKEAPERRSLVNKETAGGRTSLPRFDKPFRCKGRKEKGEKTRRQNRDAGGGSFSRYLLRKESRKLKTVWETSLGKPNGGSVRKRPGKGRCSVQKKPEGVRKKERVSGETSGREGGQP